MAYHPKARNPATRCENHPRRAGTAMSGFTRLDGGTMYLCDACVAKELDGTIDDVRAARRLEEERWEQA